MDTLRNATIVFLVKRSQGEISDICLAMKKRGFGVNKWNGAGGKVHEGETIEEAARRETQEEISVWVPQLNKVAELSYYFPHNADWNQKVHVYFAEQWDGSPTESEEMNPKWFSTAQIPFKEMWPDDSMWLPEVINGKKIKARFTFDEQDVSRNQEITFVDEL